MCDMKTICFIFFEAMKAASPTVLSLTTDEGRHPTFYRVHYKRRSVPTVGRRIGTMFTPDHAEEIPKYNATSIDWDQIENEIYAEYDSSSLLPDTLEDDWDSIEIEASAPERTLTSQPLLLSNEEWDSIETEIEAEACEGKEPSISQMDDFSSVEEEITAAHAASSLIVRAQMDEAEWDRIEAEAAY